jgi:hypothetical protein
MQIPLEIGWFYGFSFPLKARLIDPGVQKKVHWCPDTVTYLPVRVEKKIGMFSHGRQW